MTSNGRSECGPVFVDLTGFIALISKNSLSSSGQKWEIQCAREEGKPVLGIWCRKDDRTDIAGIRIKVWTWDNIKAFIDAI